MRILRRAVIILILVTAACSAAWASNHSTIDLALLRQRLLRSVGNLPWNPASGYGLEGQFVLKATGEEIQYKTRYARASNRWAADFSQENSSRNLRYVLSGKNAWVASPEITADVNPDQIPYMALFDFPQLYAELLHMLERANRDPSIIVDSVANEIRIRGRLQNRWEVSFILNTVDYFPRKIWISVIGAPTTAWLLPFTRPDGSAFFTQTPESSTKFEIWFSDPVSAEGFRYPRRMDFVEKGNVVGTFILEQSPSTSGFEALFNQPPRFPWAESAEFTPQVDWHRPSLYLNKSEIPALRSRIEENPWFVWNGGNRLIVFWTTLMLWIGGLIPQSTSFRQLTLTVIVCFLGFSFLLVRRRHQFHYEFSWRLFVAGIILSGFVLLAGIASRQLHQSQDRSLAALHAAIRYAMTGHSFYAGRAYSLLVNFAREAPPQTLEDLGHSCQAYALAYDLIRNRLPNNRRLKIETDLFESAKPLFGASHGWISNTGHSSSIAAGLGMVGLAIGHEPFIAAACKTMDRMLETQLTGGLHRSGPGQGNRAMDSASNLFYGLKHTGRADYYRHPAFQQYVSAALQMLSPVGTLPLLGDTNLEQPARLSTFFLKAANQIPEETGRQCIAAYNLYWNYGRHHIEGWRKWILPIFQPLMAYYENPYVLLQYTQPLPPAPLPLSSALFGNNQLAVLRSGASPDSIYLALNMSQPNSDSLHRNILGFDLYGYKSLLLHGPGFPGKNHPRYIKTTQTAAENSITLNNENQSATQYNGIESSLLNQPLFDHLRALADKAYDDGKVQRDIVLARPEKKHPAYFFLIDDVSLNNPATSVQWHLHGRGNLTTGIGRLSRWTSAPFSSPWSKQDRIMLEVGYPMGSPGNLTTKTGMLYSQTSSSNQKSASMTIEWTGSRRFCTILFPYKSGEAPIKIEPQGNESCRINDTDWISLGNLSSRVTVGPLTHVSEYTIVRDRMTSFPALLMVSGFECRLGPFSLFSNKPVTASLNGLYGGFRNSRPDTRVEIRSPEIRVGSQFRLDDQSIVADKSGILILVLNKAGEHFFRTFAQ